MTSFLFHFFAKFVKWQHFLVPNSSEAHLLPKIAQSLLTSFTELNLYFSRKYLGFTLVQEMLLFHEFCKKKIVKLSLPVDDEWCTTTCSSMTKANKSLRVWTWKASEKFSDTSLKLRMSSVKLELVAFGLLTSSSHIFHEARFYESTTFWSSIHLICCCCSFWWTPLTILLENSLNWKLSKLKVFKVESAKIESCQNCHNWKLLSC